MSLMKKVARNHGFRVLLHEKPFDGINGSGKHNNWSLSTDTGILLHAPGKTDASNPEATANETLRFVTFIVETLMAVYKHNGLLKASIMSATNAHRLGGNEAPPAIISSFLGTQLTELLDKIEESEATELFTLKGKQGMQIDIPQIPDLIIDNTDRNRTSPFAFTGNRFEFRAPGSSVNCASAMIALNAAMAEALTSFKVRVDQKIAEFALRPEYTQGTGHTAKFHAIVEVLREDIKTCKPVRFDGNGYSEEWVQEAARRGLDVEKSCPVIFEHYLDESSIKMFESTKVMNRKELEARNEVKWEMYVKTVQIEARVLGDLAMNHIIPVATHYQSQLIKNVQGMKDIFSSAVFSSEKATKLSARNMKLIEEIAERTERIEQLVEELTEARRVANQIANIHERAIQYHDTVCPKMEAIRKETDKLELIVEDGLWTLPKYRELLFIR
jgi:glutamine synthetase